LSGKILKNNFGVYMHAINDEKNCELCHQPGYQAYEILRFAFTIAPILAGIDKFFNMLVSWPQYLSASFNVFGDANTTMMVVGIIEIIAGIGVWFKPKIFSYIVALWLLGIIINLLILHNFYDIALRDLGLLLGAVALGRLSESYECCKTSDLKKEA
jgi:uncharacterized membrane protein YphA (DoxX/SURF4 family)